MATQRVTDAERLEVSQATATQFMEAKARIMAEVKACTPGVPQIREAVSALLMEMHTIAAANVLERRMLASRIAALEDAAPVLEKPRVRVKAGVGQ